jgi:hypothetical protein
MAESRSDDRSQARREAAVLLGVDIEHLSAADSLRVDMVSALRLVIDHEQASVLAGGSADLGKLNVAVQSLIALLPGRELPAPASSRPDPRKVMFEKLMEMRRAGQIPDEGLLQARINELEAENERLRSGEKVITPNESGIISPSEVGETYAGFKRGPDDPPRRSPPVIEGKAMRPPPEMVDLRAGFNDTPEPWREFATDTDGVPLSRPGRYWGPV